MIVQTGEYINNQIEGDKMKTLSKIVCGLFRNNPALKTKHTKEVEEIEIFLPLPKKELMMYSHKPISSTALLMLFANSAKVKYAKQLGGVGDDIGWRENYGQKEYPALMQYASDRSFHTPYRVRALMKLCVPRLSAYDLEKEHLSGWLFCNHHNTNDYSFLDAMAGECYQNLENSLQEFMISFITDFAAFYMFNGYGDHKHMEQYMEDLIKRINCMRYKNITPRWNMRNLLGIYIASPVQEISCFVNKYKYLLEIGAFRNIADRCAFDEKIQQRIIHEIHTKWKYLEYDYFLVHYWKIIEAGIAAEGNISFVASPDEKNILLGGSKDERLDLLARQLGFLCVLPQDERRMVFGKVHSEQVSSLYKLLYDTTHRDVFVAFVQCFVFCEPDHVEPYNAYRYEWADDIGSAFEQFDWFKHWRRQVRLKYEVAEAKKKRVNNEYQLAKKTETDVQAMMDNREKQYRKSLRVIYEKFSDSSKPCDKE